MMPFLLFADGCAAALISCAIQALLSIDIMRSLHNAFGYARYSTDAPFWL